MPDVCFGLASLLPSPSLFLSLKTQPTVDTDKCSSVTEKKPKTKHHGIPKVDTRRSGVSTFTSVIADLFHWTGFPKTFFPLTYRTMFLCEPFLKRICFEFSDCALHWSRSGARWNVSFYVLPQCWGGFPQSSKTSKNIH